MIFVVVYGLTQESAEQQLKHLKDVYADEKVEEWHSRKNEFITSKRRVLAISVKDEIAAELAPDKVWVDYNISLRDYDEVVKEALHNRKGHYPGMAWSSWISFY